MTRLKKKEGFHGLSLLGDAASMDKDFYKDSRMKDNIVHQALGCFEEVSIDKAENHRLYRFEFVEYANTFDSRRSLRSVAAYIDNGHELFTAAPKIRRVSFRPLFTTYTTEKLGPNVRDITTTLAMYKTLLPRPVYMASSTINGFR